MSSNSLPRSISTVLIAFTLTSAFSLSSQAVFAGNNGHGSNNGKNHGHSKVHGNKNRGKNGGKGHGQADASNGQCDSFSGKAKKLCKRAHKASNNVAALKADGSTLEALRAAEQRLEKFKQKFYELTGLPVPGLTLPCEIPELSSWLAGTNALGDILAQDSIAIPTDQGCTVYRPFTAEYSAQFPCDISPAIFIDPDTGTYGILEPSLDRPVFNGGDCGFSSYQTQSADILQVEACAIALGCDIQ